MSLYAVIRPHCFQDFATAQTLARIPPALLFDSKHVRHSFTGYYRWRYGLDTDEQQMIGKWWRKLGREKPALTRISTRKGTLERKAFHIVTCNEKIAHWPLPIYMADIILQIYNVVGIYIYIYTCVYPYIYIVDDSSKQEAWSHNLNCYRVVYMGPMYPSQLRTLSALTRINHIQTRRWISSKGPPHVDCFVSNTALCLVLFVIAL